jgi:hypothetical protein
LIKHDNVKITRKGGAGLQRDNNLAGKIQREWTLHRMVGLNVRKWGFYDKTVKNFKPFCWWDAFRSVWMTQQNAPCAHIYKIEFWYKILEKENATSSSQSWDQTVNIDLFRDIY